MRFRILAAVCLCLFAAKAAEAQKTDVLLIPGFLETSNDWSFMTAFLGNTAAYAPLSDPGIISTQSIAAQASELNNYIGQRSPLNTISMGHSQGGLVGRWASRDQTVLGILTVGSPNAGAPIASQLPTVFSYLGTLSDDGALVAADLIDLEFTTDLGLSVIWNDWVEIISLGPGVGSLAFENYLNQFFARQPNIQELQPTSATVLSLVSNPGLERASSRQAIVADLLDYYAGSFRLTSINQQVADDGMAAIQTIGALAVIDGDLLINSNPDQDENAILHEAAGFSMIEEGAILVGLPDICNYQLVGGVPNDGLLPTAVESLPDKGPLFTAAGLTHNDLLNDSNHIIAALNLMSGR